MDGRLRTRALSYCYLRNILEYILFLSMEYSINFIIRL